ncbi:MAG: 2-aminoadipate transaminase [Chloroflexi bacterium]|nr:2-aminoadipate transaminase [Chloroflexota bacterium]
MPTYTITQTNPTPGLIDLGMGNPDTRLLPVEAIHRSAEEYFAGGDPRPLQYGTEQGDGYFRAALADFLTTAYGIPVGPGQLFITCGASSALDLLCTLYTNPGNVVFVEEPTYFLALRVFEDHGLRVVPLPMDEGGLHLDALDDLLTRYRPKFLYTIPTFQNPSGRTLTRARREKLVKIAQEWDFFIVADEVYHLLSYTQSPPEPFAAYTKDAANVISVNSFSKILAPGLRLGWIQAHDRVIGLLAGNGLLDSGGGMNPFTSALMRGLVESGGLEENITHLRETYAHRLRVLDNALRRHLPQAEYAHPRGGFYFWARLPGLDTSKVRPMAQEHRVDFRPGALFSAQGEMQEYMRLCFAYYEPEKLEEGVKRLSQTLKELM